MIGIWSLFAFSVLIYSFGWLARVQNYASGPHQRVLFLGLGGPIHTHPPLGGAWGDPLLEGQYWDPKHFRHCALTIEENPTSSGTPTWFGGGGGSARTQTPRSANLNLKSLLPLRKLGAFAVLCAITAYSPSEIVSVSVILSLFLLNISIGVPKHSCISIYTAHLHSN